MYDFAIIARNYKCFSDTVLFNELKRVNLIIGRNNSGKSSILDVLEMVCTNSYTYTQDRVTWKNGETPEIAFKCKVSEEIVKRIFPRTKTGGIINGNHFDSYGKRLVDKEIEFTKYSAKNRKPFVLSTVESLTPPLSNLREDSANLINNIPIPIEGKLFRKLSSERDIVQETPDSTMKIDTNGNGITKVIHSYLYKTSYSSSVIEEEFLNELNLIYAPDSFFTSIVCQQWHNSNDWEVFLGEETKGRIPLSRSGNGLKTVIAVLSYLLLIPKIENRHISNYVFAFEELENNLHPSLLRRLSQYIYEKAKKDKFIYFLTSHSNVLIDQFSKQQDAQIIHVQQANGNATCRTASTYFDNNGILDDLDVRASDILQANGIIWVEGPSDRIYLNRWIELWTGGELREGTQYQIVFYGGRLLAHLSVDEPSNSKLISILTTNRNAALLIDSDKKSKHGHINKTKKRIREEMQNNGCFCWITKGKEIENYIPEIVVHQHLNGKNVLSFDTYSSVFESIDKAYLGKGSAFEKKKPMFAEAIISHMTKDNLSQVLDLDEKMTKLCEIIRNWNRPR